jgi:hypothetical protein
LALGAAFGSRGRAVTAQVRRNHRVLPGKRRDDPTPAEVSLRETVEEKDGWTGAGAPRQILGPSDVETPVLHVRNWSPGHAWSIAHARGGLTVVIHWTRLRSVARWLLTCTVCGRVSEVPAEREPQGLPLLKMAVPQHEAERRPDLRCPGAGRFVKPSRFAGAD